MVQSLLAGTCESISCSGTVLPWADDACGSQTVSYRFSFKITSLAQDTYARSHLDLTFLDLHVVVEELFT